jgi:flagellar P-ring protein precursor FlgI
VKLQLRRADFTTAARIASALNQRFAAEGEPPVAKADNAALVTVIAPKAYASRHVEFLADIEGLNIEADQLVKVVINERTGTIVMGKEAKIRPAAILHGGLTVEIRTSPVVSQPNPLSNGQTATTQQVAASSKEERARSVTLDQGATVEDLARALTAIGSTPRDIIAVLQNLKAAGSLEAELEVT